MKKFKATSKQTILDWVHRYQNFGIELERLKEENKLLKIENEYLKKLDALIQEPNHTDKSKHK